MTNSISTDPVLAQQRSDAVRSERLRRVAGGRLAPAFYLDRLTDWLSRQLKRLTV